MALDIMADSGQESDLPLANVGYVGTINFQHRAKTKEAGHEKAYHVYWIGRS
jgi:hypothetical protein